MSHLLVRDLNKQTLKRLKERAKQNRRSLQGEAKIILEQASDQMTMGEFRAASRRIRKLLKGRRFSDSAKLIREDRER